MVDSPLDFNAHFGNEPLPIHLRAPLRAVLDQLDHQDQACVRYGERIQQAIEEKQSIIQALEHEIERPKRVQESLANTRLSISTRRSRYTATSYAIRCIPPEILAKIMAFAISGNGGFAGKVERQYFRDLRSISWLWRQTAFSTPYLWRSLEIVANDFPPYLRRSTSHPTDSTFAQSVTSWFRRGGDNAPLSLNMPWVTRTMAEVLLTAISDSKLNLTLAIISIILDRDGKAYGGSDDLAFLLESTLDGTPPLPLKVLRVHVKCPRHDEGTGSRESLDLTNHLPNLSTLSLSFTEGAIFPLCPASVIHATLRRLSLHRTQLPAEEVEFILAGLPRLQVLCLTRCTLCSLETKEATSSPNVHSGLKRLDIHRSIPAPFLSRLTCPSLSSLTVTGRVTPDCGAELKFLRGFMGRCGGSIRFTFYGKVVGAAEP
ncbi:hypothetical protein BKA70DRAFT_1577780, partial [Coprinopsis sp. MPI-PUGE-AT-0042]